MSTHRAERSEDAALGPAGDRSVPAPAGARREPAGPRAGSVADPEVASVAKRRRHSTDYKLKILEEIDASPGKTGLILRREGLYSSYLTKWRQWKDEESMQKKPTSENKQMHNEMAKLKRENARLTLQLQKAEGIIGLQKKASELLTLMSLNENVDS
ncbi:MAG: transposase [Candidatus Promineifilaceae bacterium]|jgi:transposase